MVNNTEQNSARSARMLDESLNISTLNHLNSSPKGSCGSNISLEKSSRQTYVV